MSVLIVGLSYICMKLGMSYPTLTRGMMQNFLAFRDSPIIPLRRSPGVGARGGVSEYLSTRICGCDCGAERNGKTEDSGARKHVP